MRLCLPMLIAALMGCRGYDRGFDDGCAQGSLDGAMWGGADAALCYTAVPAPVVPATVGPPAYDRGFVEGYDSCFVTEYLDAWDFMLLTLEEDLGPCDELVD